MQNRKRRINLYNITITMSPIVPGDWRCVPPIPPIPPIPPYPHTFSQTYKFAEHINEATIQKEIMQIFSETSKGCNPSKLRVFLQHHSVL